MPTTPVSEEEFVAAGGDPAKMPTLGGEAPGSEEAPPGNITDIRPTFTIAGLKARPVSAGVIAILEEIDHPFAKDGADPEGEQKMSDIVSFLYILTCPDEGLLVEQAENGTLKTAAIKWSLTLDMEVMEEAQEVAGQWMNEAGSVMAGMTGDESPDAPKKNSG